MDINNFLAIAELVLQSFLVAIFSPIFWIIVVVIYFQYNRISRQKEEMFGIKEKLGLKHTLTAAAHGVLGGLVGSFLMVFMGVSLSGIGIQFLWLLAIMLLLISPRFICFAYAGGIISLSNIIFGFPEVDVPMLIGLVAILHMVESVLILVSGHLGALPLYTKLADGRIVGGFNLQKFWPIPLIALALMVVPDPQVVSGVGMPDWWPLIKPNIEGDPNNFIYQIFPVAAALGYGDLALTQRPKEKSRKTALLLGSYSMALLGLAVLASHFSLLMLLPALFSPLGHELVIKLGRDEEFKGEPKYVAPPQGVMVLEVLSGSIAQKIGLKTGDIILNINGFPVNSNRQLAEVMYWGGTGLELEYIDSNSNKFNRLYTRKSFHDQLGIIPVPGEDENNYAVLSTQGFISRWWERRKNKGEK
ncbi:MAG: PDZ domain-containing protein [Bacillota bacterium]|nr:PDZ domain-containing protein [Bacillota bacterium]